MVLQELGQKLKDALNKLNKSDNIDQKLLKEMLTTLSIALIKSDVNLHLVKKLTTNIQSKFDEIQEETEINTAKKVVVGGWYLLLFYVMSESYLCPRTTEPMFMCH